MTKKSRERDKARRQIARAFSGAPPALESCPGLRDPRKLLEHGLATVVRISFSEDPKYAMAAGLWLIDYATRALEQRRKPKEASEARTEIISELRGLYAKALNGAPRTSPLVVESIELVPDS